MKKLNPYSLLPTLILSTLLVSCSPVNTSISDDNNLSNFKTGGNTTVINPYTKKENVVSYVNSGDKNIFKETITEANAIPTEQREMSNNILSKKIKTVQLFFYNDHQQTDNITKSNQVRLIIKVQGKNKTYHTFTTTKESLNNISGVISSSLKTNAPTKPSKLRADINCKSDDCNKTIITLTLPQKSTADNIDFDVISKIAYTKTKAKIKVEASKGQLLKLEESDLYKNINKANEGEEYPVHKISVVVADGVSYTEVHKDDLINIKVETTDTREAPAQIDKSNIQIKNTQIKNSSLSGISTGGSTIIDITAKQIPKKDSVIKYNVLPVTASDLEVVNTDTTKEVISEDNLQARITVISKEEDQAIQEKELNKNFQLTEIQKLINTGTADWQDVGINPNTSLFFTDVTDAEEKKKILLAEADFESYREHPIVQQQIEKRKGNICSQYIKNMAPLRKIISEIHVQNNISPNFASLMYTESMYGKNDKYQVETNPLCETSSGPYQITNGTFESILNYNGLAKNLRKDGYGFIIRDSKMYYNNSSNPNDRTRCKEETPEVRLDDHRMFLESSAILGSSYSRYIYFNQHQEDAALVFGAYNQGAGRFTRLAKKKENSPKFAVFKTRLEDIERYNISTFQNLSGEKQFIKDSVDSGILYSFKTLAVRSILSQPESYCENLSQEEIQSIYANADQLIKDPSFQDKTTLLHPSGAILESTKSIIKN